MGALRATRRNVCFTSHFIPLTKNPSPWCPGFGLISSEQSTGITVNETTKEAAMLVMVAMAMGVNRRPSMPSSVSRGRKTRMMSTVA